MRLAPETSERAGWRGALRWALAVLAVALGARLLHLWLLRDALVLEVLMGDSRSYDAWARRIAAGDWLGDEVFYQAPLYPYFLAVVHRTLGDSAAAVRLVQCVLGAASCGLLALAGWRYHSKAAGLVAGLGLALYAPALFADTTLQKSVLDLFFLCLSLCLLADVARGSGAASAIGLGAAVGALVLTRENALVLAAVLLPWLVLRAPPRGARRLLAAALFAAGLAAVLLPVALRNVAVGGEFHLTTSQLGPNFYIGNNPEADGRYAPLRAGRGDPLYERTDAAQVAEAALGRELAPGEVSAYFVRESLAWIASEPGKWLRLMGRKLALAANAVELVDTEDQYTHAESSWLLRVLGRGIHFGTLAPLALFGVVVTGRRWRRLAPLHLLVLAYLGSLIAFYVFARYRLPLVPPLLLLAGAGLAELPRFLEERGHAALWQPLLATAMLAVACNWPLVDRGYMQSVTRYNLGNELVARDRLDEAVAQYREALRLYPGNAGAHNNLGFVFSARGDHERALGHYETALRLDPEHPDALLNLARALHDSGELARAREAYGRGIRRHPDRAELHVELGELLVDLGEVGPAIESFERALRMDASLEEARRSLETLRGRSAY